MHWWVAGQRDQTDRQMNRQMAGQTDRQRDGWVVKGADKQADEWVGFWTDRQRKEFYFEPIDNKLSCFEIQNVFCGEKKIYHLGGTINSFY
jgi:hypothetical protein